MGKFTLAKPVDMSDGFKDFFATIALSGNGLIKFAIPAVLVVIALIMAGKAIKDPKTALQRGVMAVGTLAVAVVLAMYGDVLFSTVTDKG